jgi:SNF2 family DNA or RNA helicase
VSPIERKENLPSVKLLPHQSAFVDAFFNINGKRIVLLRGDVGLGKGVALVAMLSRLLEEHPEARALLIAPAALRTQFANMLQSNRCPALLVDRYRYRELLDSTGTDQPWPRGVVSVVSREFSQIPDILDSLAQVEWNVVVDDESQLTKGTRAEALRRISAGAKRVVLASVSSLAADAVFPDEDVTVVEWRRNEIVNHDGKLLSALPRPLLHEVPFHYSRTEVRILERMRDLDRIELDGKMPYEVFANLLLRSFESSPIAFEESLRRVGESATRNSADNDGMDFGLDDDEFDGKDSKLKFWDEVKSKVSDFVQQTLQELETVGDDSKLMAFGAQLARLSKVEDQPTYICVVTNYVSTLYYLVAEVEDHGVTCRQLHGDMEATERAESLNSFIHAGGILVTTRAAMTEGVNLPQVTDLVLYDAPIIPDAIETILARFDRFGRSAPLRIHVLSPSNVASSAVTQSLATIRNLISGSQPGVRT